MVQRPSADRRRARHGRARLSRTTGSATAVQENNPHLHNVPMQIAAERGLPALVLWLWFVVVGASPGLRAAARRAARSRRSRPRRWRRSPPCSPPGMFEYNFGDSEFLMLFLVLLTLPFAAARDGGRRTMTLAGRLPRSPLASGADAHPRASPARRVLVDRRRDARPVHRRPREPHLARSAGAGRGRYDRDEYRAGGAANVALNVARARRRGRRSSAWSVTMMTARALRRICSQAADVGVGARHRCPRGARRRRCAS